MLFDSVFYSHHFHFKIFIFFIFKSAQWIGIINAALPIYKNNNFMFKLTDCEIIEFVMFYECFSIFLFSLKLMKWLIIIDQKLFCFVLKGIYSFFYLFSFSSFFLWKYLGQTFFFLTEHFCYCKLKKFSPLPIFSNEYIIIRLLTQCI